MMVEIVYYVASSLDGYIATTDGGVEWLPAIESTGEDYGYYAFYASIDALLMGSHTYEQVLRHGRWPYSGKPCWVFSRRQLQVAQAEIILTSQSPRDIVAELHTRRLHRVWLVGGGELAESFRAQGLITEYVIGVIPTILGAGIPLFASPGPREQLKLIECKAFPRGEVLLRYLQDRDD
jgi:dihydrofolate reductase